MAMKSSFTKALLVAASWTGIVLSAPNPYCKPIPGDSNWPSPADWQALNETVEGRLIQPVPPGVVCQPTNAAFNNVSCFELASTQWLNSTFHASNPFTADYNDDTCKPNPTAPCSASGYPAYVINATTAEHVQAGVAFAHKTGVRLIVKGTGHDWNGRSSGRNALSIYTHNIRGIEINHTDPRNDKYGGVATAKIFAGMRGMDIYPTASMNNVTIVCGADPGVGIGGWLLGTGHSPISAAFGFGADQAIEMEVVTANGTLLTINEDNYPGLFWAMRGGGGSTFGVLISVTVRAFATFPGTIYIYSYNTTASSDSFWNLTTYFHQQIPELGDAGLMGYYYSLQDATFTGETNSSQAGKLFGAWLCPNKTLQEVQDLLAPMEAAFTNTSMNWGDPIIVSGYGYEMPDVAGVWGAVAVAESVSSDGRLGSRLLNREALSTDREEMTRLFKQANSVPYIPMLGHLVSGERLRDVKIPGGSNAVLPAWRDSYTHIVLPRIWDNSNETVREATATYLREVEVAALRELAPNTGAYVNEADPTEPDWQKTFWGDNYPRLLEMKNKWDPDGVFWCKPCVGHGQWEVVSDLGVEGAIGQLPGRICRKE